MQHEFHFSGVAHLFEAPLPIGLFFPGQGSQYATPSTFGPLIWRLFAASKDLSEVSPRSVCLSVPKVFVILVQVKMLEKVMEIGAVKETQRGLCSASARRMPSLPLSLSRSLISLWESALFHMFSDSQMFRRCWRSRSPSWATTCWRSV